MEVEPDRTLNSLGLFCPEPVIKTREELNKMQVNQILEVLANDPAAEADIRSLVKHLHQQLLSVTAKENFTRILIKKIK